MSEIEEAPDTKRRVGIGMIFSLIGVGVLLIFVLQNREPIEIHFLTLTFTWPLWVYTILVAVFGAMVWFGMGVMRRRRRRKDRREG